MEKEQENGDNGVERPKEGVNSENNFKELSEPRNTGEKSEEYKFAKSVIPTLVEKEIQKSYIDYAMSVIVGRALPDVRDGLKPVHRRILFTMNEIGLAHNKPFKKSANIVGTCMAKYHPHGDAAIYDSLVRMAQDFSLRYLLVDGQGNFGNVDGDSAAAMRYTEARMKQSSEDMLADIEKETVTFAPNYDQSEKEPLVLPAKFPNLLVNGSSGIAVGMATNMPPHNMGEICGAIIAAIKNPKITIPELNQIVTGPDFPTGGLIIGRRGITQAYLSGRGKVRVRARTKIEEHKTRNCIIVTEIPYQVNKSALVTEIADLIKEKKVAGVLDLRDESGKEGIRVVIEVKKDISTDIILNQLYRHSSLESVFGIINIALVDNVPRVLNLRELIDAYISHRKDVITRRTRFDLRVAQEKRHILEGIIIALNSIDRVIEAIKKSKDIDSARQVLMQAFGLTELQAKAILEMRLSRLASMEQQKVRDEHGELGKQIADFKDILTHDSRIFDIITRDLESFASQYKDARRSTIIDGEEDDIEIEDLIEPADVVVTISHAGYIKRQPMDAYKSQNRGGKGIIGASTREDDFISDLFIANTHSYILFFTSKGKAYWLKVYNIPEASRIAKGSAIVNMLALGEGEKITAFIPIKAFAADRFLVMATKKGVVKKTNLMSFSKPRQSGIIAILLDDDDTLDSVKLTEGASNLIIATAGGLAVKFPESKIRPMGRNSRGVRGITIKGADYVVGMEIADDAKPLLTITENGYGKRTIISEYRLINRGGSGVINIQCSDRNGKVAAIMQVDEEDEIMLGSKQGIIIRMPVRNISLIGRNTQGVRLMKLSEQDKVVTAAKVRE